VLHGARGERAHPAATQRHGQVRASLPTQPVVNLVLVAICSLTRAPFERFTELELRDFDVGSERVHGAALKLEVGALLPCLSMS
jgi:hypothetical protein